MKKLLATLAIVASTAALAACGPTTKPSEDPTSTPNPGPNPTEPTTVTPEPGPSVKDYDGTETQGITDTEILIGNTAATTGAFATVGEPFNVGLNVALKMYNDMGGFGGKKVRLVHYDDEFDGAKGLQYTKTLVEQDKVFSLVGHFGTNTVAATVDYIKEQGVPMVYAATGINDLYQEGAEGYNKSVMPVQPIFKTEGRVLLARAMASTEGNYGLGGKKIGVIYTSDDAGKGMLEFLPRVHLVEHKLGGAGLHQPIDHHQKEGKQEVPRIHDRECAEDLGDLPRAEKIDQHQRKGEGASDKAPLR
jgi:ABC-type branched-subunit amino acid transport system substrate-binding protein